ncbi:hypothetical protein WL40_22550 [Burkholderia ubonensis]|uniref:Lipoprotein n=2 Tax=Burkholderia cepacia complex TaxID=87882 RepID=A0AAW3NYS6_9BURK|nr:MULTISPECIES: hypothetical protein [Burkholderia cepacia complex]AOK18643.1 hypothetical protein WT26_21725 [Burkholderia cepacia]AOK25398.1 hypothetical protein WK67_21650 [Burkholderia ubonensis]KVH70686.1 hypothetical protein WJ41_17035 [Burkholderia ubonensis]KVN76125.1 hypothetical protein WJ68_26230 [Burkholderia ubonensis]KVP67687.1 hypothetical protein WJ92_00135 [Burkholderia ubonensis]
MRSETRKIAGFAAMVCGGMASMGAAAMPDGTPAATVECVVQTSGAASGLPASGRAQDERDWPAGGAVALSDTRLDAMRGGFDLPGGLQVSFGISRVAFVNGNLVTTTNFNIPDVSQITAQQAQALAAANLGALIQVGPGNAAQPGALPGLTGAVIQNTLSNQHIQALTTIDTSVNTLSMFKNLNIMSTLNNALTGVLPGR